MSWIVLEEGGVCSPKGYVAAGVRCGIKESGKPDLALLYSKTPARTWGTFTRNATCAAPVQLCRKQLQNSSVMHGVVVNSGNANACTGSQGQIDAQKMIELSSLALQVDVSKVLVASTGIIGRALPMEKVTSGIAEASQTLSINSLAFADAILTTDTRRKTIAVEIETSLGNITVGGSSKGAGMIHPDMATMLAFVTTDLALPESFGEEAKALVNDSFNSITVDGDISTNDTCLFMANGACGFSYEDLSLSEQGNFRNALFEVYAYLAKAIVKDGEGATKFVEIEIDEAPSKEFARNLGRYVGNSKLVKTAFFGEDPNWGRLIASVGAFSTEIQESRISIYLDQLPILLEGEPAATELSALEKVVQKPEFKVKISLGLGSSIAQIWTCDLSYEYVKINAEYTT